MNAGAADLPQSPDAIAECLAEAACIAAAALVERRGCSDARAKADGSPVCSADLAADHRAKDALARLLPGVAVISEESVEGGCTAETFILLDPLDGTREFLAGGDSYCVAIALIRGGRPVAGAIAAPVRGRCWFAGEHAFAQDLDARCARLGSPRAVAVRPVPAGGPHALVSRFHGDPRSAALCEALGVATDEPISSAIKFALIASGDADLHIRCGQTMEWDIAAGDAILRAAGGALLMLDGTVPVYGRAAGGWRNEPFVAASTAALAEAAVTAAAAMPAQ